jgi:hypothetical protein
MLSRETMPDKLDKFLASYSRETRENVLCLRQLILDLFHAAVEQVDENSGLIAYGFRGSGYEGLVFAIMPHRKHVNLMFSKGTQIPDPARLLSGTGKQARHVRITSEAETQNPALRQLLQAALKIKYEN